MNIILRKKSISLLLLISAFISQLCFAATTRIDWQPCENNPLFQCASISVPKNYKHPKSETISLSIAKHIATGTQLGTIVFNTGGPWSDDTVSIQYLFPELSDSIKEHFNIIGFAPRGTGLNPITCQTDQIEAEHEIERDLNLTYMNSEAGAERDYESICDLPVTLRDDNPIT